MSDPPGPGLPVAQVVPLVETRRIGRTFRDHRLAERTVAGPDVLAQTSCPQWLDGLRLAGSVEVGDV